MPTCIRFATVALLVLVLLVLTVLFGAPGRKLGAGEVKVGRRMLDLSDGTLTWRDVRCMRLRFGRGDSGLQRWKRRRV